MSKIEKKFDDGFSDFSEWLFSEMKPEMKKILVRLTAEYFQEARMRFYLPVTSKNPVDDRRDPFSVAVCLQDSYDPIFIFSISDALEDYVSSCEKDGSYLDGLEKVSARMKQISARIDAVREKRRE
jgi:hypothetical protein